MYFSLFFISLRKPSIFNFSPFFFFSFYSFISFQANFVIGRTTATRHRIYLIDFGLVQHVPTRTQLEHQRKSNKLSAFRGTLRYASLNAHHGKILGCVDDLYSLLFVLVELHTGKLPWSHLHDKVWWDIYIYIFMFIYICI